MPACRSPSSANRFGMVAMVKSPGSASSTSSHRIGADTSASATPRGVGAADGVVTGVLVVVDEDRRRVPVLAPPGQVDQVAAPPDLPRERVGRPSHVLEAPPGL